MELRGNNSLLACLAFLIALSGSVGAITVDSCETLSIANETYNLNTDINSSGTCLTIGASDVILDCQENSITGENASGSYGISANGKSNVTIKNCNIRDYQYGIYLDSSNSSTLENNTASSNARWGIILDSSSFNSLTNNTAHSNGYDGILLDTSSNNNTLTNNNASSNVWFGIYLDTSSEFNTLDDNT
ncbi:MAG: right-handed parallel beta-helix repeat-containing protein, partial [Candidatus Hydrothermarchaeaceae archaeon]